LLPKLSLQLIPTFAKPSRSDSIYLIQLFIIAKRPKRIYSPTKQKALLLLTAGVIIGLSRSPGRASYVIKKIPKLWQGIDRQYLYRIMREFHNDRLVDYREREDGTIDITLTEKGKRRTIAFGLETMTIALPKQWDGKWRIIFYDIPETKKAAREALRKKIKELGFYEWQKSVFVYPYPCQDRLDFLIEFFEIRPYVRYGEITKILNEVELKLRFNLT